LSVKTGESLSPAAGGCKVVFPIRWAICGFASVLLVL
jgi:hypothetical protein